MKLDGDPRRWVRTCPDVWAAVEAAGLLDALAAFDPVVAGSWPLAVALPGADVDILCHAPDLERFAAHCRGAFGGRGGSTQWRRAGPPPAVVCRFQFQGRLFEVFGQDLAVERQNAYRHMVVEGRLLGLYGLALREEVLRLKADGFGTEAAFARALGLAGDPYAMLLDLEGLSDTALKRRCRFEAPHGRRD